MKVIEKITEVNNVLDELDEYSESLNDRLSEVDGRTQDLLHYVEENNLSVWWVYKFVRELKKIRMERRQIKNDIAIMYEYNKSKNKLISKDMRKFMLNDVHKREKQLNQPYKNSKYEDGEIEKILKSKCTDD